MKTRSLCLIAAATLAASLFAPTAFAEGTERAAACKKETALLKGEEHDRAYAKCLKADKVARTDSPAQDRQQNKMKACNAEAGKKELKGDERRAFMSSCLKG
jgi:hypothetical protein